MIKKLKRLLPLMLLGVALSASDPYKIADNWTVQIEARESGAYFVSRPNGTSLGYGNGTTLEEVKKSEREYYEKIKSTLTR